MLNPNSSGDSKLQASSSDDKGWDSLSQVTFRGGERSGERTDKYKDSNEGKKELSVEEDYDRLSAAYDELVKRGQMTEEEAYRRKEQAFNSAIGMIDESRQHYLDRVNNIAPQKPENTQTPQSEVAQAPTGIANEVAQAPTGITNEVAQAPTGITNEVAQAPTGIVNEIAQNQTETPSSGNAQPPAKKGFFGKIRSIFSRNKQKKDKQIDYSRLSPEQQLAQLNEEMQKERKKLEAEMEKLRREGAIRKQMMDRTFGVPKKSFADLVREAEKKDKLSAENSKNGTDTPPTDIPGAA